MPKVSVIIPTYNRAGYLPEAIDSVLCQTYQDFEIIIVDDGSFDNTKKIIGEYIVSYPGKIRYFYQTNQGPGAARNKGIKMAKGEHIAFLDSDDRWKPAKLLRQLKMLEQDESLALVFTDMQQNKEDKVLHRAYLREKGYDVYAHEKDIFAKLVERIFIYTPTVIVRRDILNTVGLFNEKYRVGEDYDLWLRIAKKFSIGFISTPLVIRQLHGSNVCNNRGLFYQEHINLFRDFLRSSLFDKKQRRILMQKLQECHYELGYYYFLKEEYKKSLQFFVKCFHSKYMFKSSFYFLAALFPAHLVNTLRGIKRKMGSADVKN